MIVIRVSEVLTDWTPKKPGGTFSSFPAFLMDMVRCVPAFLCTVSLAGTAGRGGFNSSPIDPVVLRSFIEPQLFAQRTSLLFKMQSLCLYNWQGSVYGDRPGT